MWRTCGCVLLTIAAVFQVVTGQVVIQAIRLAGVNSTSTAGRVEVQVGGTFGTVCDDLWDDKDASVVCKQLGLTGGTALKNAAYGSGTGPILLDDVDCKGDEDNLNDCYFSTANINCNHNEDASVVCQPAGSGTTPSPVVTTTQSGVTQPDNCAAGNNQQARVRLFGPQSQPGVGYVQVRADNGTYGFVCDDNWDVNAAKVVCGELCYDLSLTEPGMKKEYRVGVDSVVFALDDVECVGTESSLVDCQHDPWFQHDCIASELAAVTCVEVVYPTPTPPSPNLQCRNGDLIALFSKARDPNLEAKHLTLASPCPTFTVDDSDADYITVTIPFDDCGTNVTQNETHIIYTNTVLMESTSREGAITSVNDYRIELTCEMPRNATVDTDVRPLTETITQKAEGEFVITMNIYLDRGFSQPATVYPHELTLGQWLNAAVDLEAVDSRLKLVVTDCLASPNLTDTSAPTVTLLQDKCVADRSTLEVYPLSKVKFGLRMQSFVFVSYPLVVLQCNAIVCLTSEVTSECDRSCNNSKPAPNQGSSSGSGGGSGGNRRRRDVSGSGAGSGSKTVYTVRSQPVVVVVQPLTNSTARPPSTSSLSNFNTTTSATTSTTTTTATTTTTKSTTPSARTTASSTVTTTKAAATSVANASSAITTSTAKSSRSPTTTNTTTKPTTTTRTTTAAPTTTTTTTAKEGSSPSLSPGGRNATGREGVSTTPSTARTPILITVRGTPVTSPTAAKRTSVPADTGTTLTPNGALQTGGIVAADSSAPRRLYVSVSSLLLVLTATVTCVCLTLPV